MPVETIKVEIMKTRTLLLGILAICLGTLRASAYGLGDIRVNARFLTDRMAFELHLNTNQYDDLYEINYDFFSGINPYVSRIAAADDAAVDLYYRYLDIRNDDLRWVLSNAEYARFITLDYFFRPLYTLNNVCHLRIYTVYPNRTYFYFGPPRHYLTYRGGHCRTHFGGKSYYQRVYPTRYRHPVYAHAKPARPAKPHHGLGRPGARPGKPAPEKPHARPQKNPGFHFTPVGHGPEKPNRPNGMKPHKPNGNKPGIKPGKPHSGKPGKPEYSRPEMSRPGKAPSRRPDISRPAKPQTQKRPATHHQRNGRKERTTQPSRPNRQVEMKRL